MKTITFNTKAPYPGREDILLSVRAKDNFNYSGITFCVHRPWYGFLNQGLGGFSKRSWTVSEKTTGANIGKLSNHIGEEPKTMIIAKNRALDKLSTIDTQDLTDKINNLPKLNY